MAVKKGTYKVDNGSSFDEIMLKTTLEQVQGLEIYDDKEGGLVKDYYKDGYIIREYSNYASFNASGDGYISGDINFPFEFYYLYDLTITISTPAHALKGVVAYQWPSLPCSKIHFVASQLQGSGYYKLSYTLKCQLKK